MIATKARNAGVKYLSLCQTIWVSTASSGPLHGSVPNRPSVTSAATVDEVYGHVDIHDPAFDAALRTVWGEPK